MPPPLPQQQGSRAGLITAIVVSVVLLLVSIILNFYQNSQLTEAQQAVDKATKKYDPVIRRDFTSDSPDLTNLNAVKAEMKAPPTQTWMDTALQETKDLAAIIRGTAETSAVSAPAIVQSSKDLLASTAKELQPLGVSIATDSLQAAIGNLTNAIKERQAQVDKARADLAAVTQKEQEEAKQYAAAVQERDQQVAEANKKAAEAVAQQGAIEADKTKAVADAGDQSKTLVDNNTKVLAEKDAAIAQLKADAVKAAQVLERVQGRMAVWRQNVKDPIIRQADARIIRVGSANDVYIDLGAGDRLTPGLTFEVYDKNDGIPKLGDGVSPDNMPVGKASIEVTNIGQNSSRCRVIKTAPGQTLSEGDICVNLVYDRHTKYNFMVYGDFDMNGDGIFTAGEADMVRNLVRRWGGNVVNKINAQTDFLILGKEPEVPLLTAEEKNDAILNAKWVAAQEALAKYEAVVNEASALHIPIMNQNRFLYYTGYYDLVKR